MFQKAPAGPGKTTELSLPSMATLATPKHAVRVLLTTLDGNNADDFMRFRNAFLTADGIRDGHHFKAAVAVS